MSFDQSFLLGQISRGFDPTLGVPHITQAGTKLGLDCFHKCLRLMELRPHLRAVIGSIQVWCEDQLQESRPWYWQKPWPFHCWCINPETDMVLDPSMHDNLDIWAQVSSVRLSRQWDEGPKVGATLPVLESPLQLMPYAQMFSIWPLNEEPECCDLIYLPGMIWNGQQDVTGRLKSHEVVVWNRAARTTTVEGGLSAKELEALLEMVDADLSLVQPEPQGEE